MNRKSGALILAVLLGISVTLNGIFFVRLYHPGAWRALQLIFTTDPIATKNDHIRGNIDAATTIIEYGDFQCPLCKKLHRHLNLLVEERDVRWIYRHYPITDLHPMAWSAAHASECAGEQDNFWPYADRVFEHQRFLSHSRLLVIAAQLKLDMEQFESCMESERYAEKITRHIEQGRRLLFTGTPTVFINDHRIDGLVPYEELRSIVEIQSE